MAMFDNESVLAEQMKKELARIEYELEDGEKVSNIQGICQNLIGRALDGDIGVIELIAELTGGKK